jgi:hypothetical protein
MTIRLLPPETLTNVTVPSGNKYTGTPGTPVDVPETDAAALIGAGWTAVGSIGPTRPTMPLNVATTLPHLDTKADPINPPHVFTTDGGKTWRNSAGAKA